MHSTSFRLASIALSSAVLFGCGGSDDTDSDYTSAYVQFYNASPNGATVTMRDEEGSSFGTAQFADTTALYTVVSEDYEFEFIRTDADDQEVVVDTLSTTLREGEKNIIILSGDFADPRLNEYTFERETLEDHFRLMGITVTANEARYDMYLSDAGQPFEAATLLGTVEHDTLTEYEYWDGDDDSEHFDEGEYTIYLTLPGETDVIFESPTVDFEYDTEYVLAIRDLAGAIQTGIAVDVILNSSSLTSITDVEASSQYRVYNSTNFDGGIEFALDGATDSAPITIAEGGLTDFIEIDFGDYQLNATSDDATENLTNQLVTLNQGESKAIVIYYDGTQLKASTFIESGLPQSYDKTINFINTVPDYDAVDFYLVRKDETVDTAEYRINNVEFGEADVETLPADYYEIIAVYEEGEETLLLDRTELIGLVDEANYIISLEPGDQPDEYEIIISQ